MACEAAEEDGMEILKSLWTLVASEMRSARWNEFRFEHVREATLVLLALCATLGIVLLIRRLLKKPGRKTIFLPAIFPSMRSLFTRYLRHIIIILGIAGFAFYIIALADPTSPFGYEEKVVPGKRIAIVIDVSGSMTGDFYEGAGRLKVREKSRYGVSISTADYFMRLRMKSKQQDLVALIEFGTLVHVINQFTPDQRTVLMNIDLVNDPNEWRRVDTQGGTYILRAIYEGLQLFKTYGFLEATGNAMVVITDGEDTTTPVDVGEKDRRVSVDEITAEARRLHVPIYFLRVNYDQKLVGDLAITTYGDGAWRSIASKTKGKFFPVYNDQSVIAAANAIDSVAETRITKRFYDARKPQFRIFALVAGAIWSLCLLLWSLIPFFRKFPS